MFVKKRDAAPPGVIKESSFFHKNVLIVWVIQTSIIIDPMMFWPE